MGSAEKPHAICIPCPAQGHITPVLQVAKLLHSKGLFITFVNTEFNHKRLLKSRGPDALKGLPDFRFVTIPDGLPPSDIDATQDVPTLSDSILKNFFRPFCDLISKLNDPSSGVPPVTCVIGDGVMTFSLEAGNKFGIPAIMLWTASACGCLGYTHYRHLVERGIVPLKDPEDLTNGYLNMAIDWVTGFENMRLKDFPSFVRTTDRNDIMLNYFIHETSRAPLATVVMFNTFDDLEGNVLSALSSMLPPMYPIGPLSLLTQNLLPPDSPLSSIGSSLWKEESVVDWLEDKPVASVLLVSFGSVTVMTTQELVEFAWGLANSEHYFIWVIRPDAVKGDSAVLPPEFNDATKERSLIVNWCGQDQVLAHKSVGGFLTHCGWNSMTETICSGVPVICWPFFAEQQTNARYANMNWGIGMEIGDEVRREVVERLIRELMGGQKGAELRKKAKEWKDSAVKATSPGGSSFVNFEKVVNEVILAKKHG